MTLPRYQRVAWMNMLIDKIEAQHSTRQARCRAVIQMLFDLTEAAPNVMAIVIQARHRDFLPEETAICSASAFVRMQRFVFTSIDNGELRAINPVVAAVMMNGAAIGMVCLQYDGFTALKLDDYFEELWVNTGKSLKF